MNKWGRWLLAAAIVLLAAGGTLGTPLLSLYEKQYPVLSIDDHFEKGQSYVLFVAGGDFIDKYDIPADYRYGDVMYRRMGEALRIAQHLESRGIDYRVAVSIQMAHLPTDELLSCAKDFFTLHHIPESKVSLLEEDCFTSRMELQALKRLGGRPVIVSSASHIPRLMLIARLYGMDDALPAPAGIRQPRLNALSFIPSAEQLFNLRTLIYECMGLAEAKLLFHPKEESPM